MSSLFEDFFDTFLSLELIQLYILAVQTIKKIKKINWNKKKIKMADKIKMTAKYKFSITQSIFV
jgi:hypothetical protein